MTNPAYQRVFGVSKNKKGIILYTMPRDSKSRTFHVTSSSDTINFYPFDDTGVIITEHGTLESVNQIDTFRITEIEGGYFLVYTVLKNHKTVLYGATSHDAIHWYRIASEFGYTANALILPAFLENGSVGLVRGGAGITVSESSDFIHWQTQSKVLIKPNSVHEYIIAGAFMHKDRLLLLYYKKRIAQEGQYELYAQILNPETLEPEISEPKRIWTGKDEFTKFHAQPLGCILFKNIVYSYWQNREGVVRCFSHHTISSIFQILLHKKNKTPAIYKLHSNPILKPKKDHIWESQAVFNAAAIYDNNKVHLLYRAVGDTGVSMIGYAASDDGMTFSKRLHTPIYVPSSPFEGNASYLGKSSISPFISGPGWGGCEDPRITKIDKRFYMIYVAFNGYSEPRLAMTSISEEHFHSNNWKWSNPVLISKPGEVNKSGALLPEKIRGKYVIFHRVYPNILIDYVESLEFDGQTFLDDQYRISPRVNHWDSRKVGVGAVPIKTKDGWLLIYNAVDNKDDSRYKIGAMLLDLEHPEKVLVRSNYPILEPTEHYENHGLKYGVVYPCGAVVLDNQLIVYYGGSDMYVCAATAYLPTFLKELKHNKPVRLMHTSTDCRFIHTYTVTNKI